MSKMTKFGAELTKAMSEALAHSQGKHVAGMRAHSVDLGSADAKLIRQSIDPTKSKIAAIMSTSPSGGKK